MPKKKTPVLKKVNDPKFLAGYDQGIKDSLITIKSILQHNNIRMQTKEFWIEFKNLLQEGKIKWVV